MEVKERMMILIKEFLAALLCSKNCERSELFLEFRTCYGLHTFDLLFKECNFRKNG